MENLFSNQKKAINISLTNNFKSGIHFHATGTGKSYIALQLLLEYNERNKNSNILWLCEQKSILSEQFDIENINKKGFKKIYDKFTIINLANSKKRKWYEYIDNLDNELPLLLIINRSYLVSNKNYEKIRTSFNLIIHDECHSIKNKTTQEFYNYMLGLYNISCIGFSATPYLENKPYDNILSEYTILDAFKDNIILPPKIIWYKSDEKIDDIQIIKFCKKYIDKLYYKKIIIWCGIIKNCDKLYELWKLYFPDFYIGIDTSNSKDNDYDTFKDTNDNSILFCACKHREGSDIKNLDCCIFLDKVENRNSKTFVQCIGRVLRKDSNYKKEYGLIIDLKANSCINICDRMNEYLSCDNIFPWKYNYYIDDNIVINELLLTIDNNTKLIKNINCTDSNIINNFIRECPSDSKYQSRLKHELNLINKKNLNDYLLKAVEILKITNNIPHVTRGSCGSSLVCYLLGISNVDPVVNNISFSRFLNEYRNSLPDIDLDFPHYLRDEVFLKLELVWPNKVARISNKVHWHEKSALREALRKIGINKQIPKNELNNFIKRLSADKQRKVKLYQKQLENTFRHYSLHCGGIIFYDEGIPEDLKLNKKKTLNQIIYDKNDISKLNKFKIDILSSRAISQLMYIDKNINFEFNYDKKTFDILKNGNNIGITLAESPLIRKAFLKIKPNNIHDIAIALAIIRPAAEDVSLNGKIDYNNKLIYDDDAISLLSKNLNIDEDLADKFRRNISKNNWNKEDKILYDQLLSKLDPKNKKDLTNKLEKLRKYSFCKSHSYSYAQLVYKLSFYKANEPKKFWEATLKNSNSSYRKWVHIYEAFKNGVNYEDINNKDISIYAENRRKKFLNLSFEQQMKNYGYWDMNKYSFYENSYFYQKTEDVYYFCGLIANIRILDYTKKIIVSLVCTRNEYIEIISKGIHYNNKFFGVKGRAKILSRETKTFGAYICKYF